MQKKLLLSFAFTCLLLSIGKSQCINTTQYPSNTIFINSCSAGTITTCNWALEFSDLSFSTTGNFTFYSSIPTDYLTLTPLLTLLLPLARSPYLPTFLPQEDTAYTFPQMHFVAPTKPAALQVILAHSLAVVHQMQALLMYQAHIIAFAHQQPLPLDCPVLLLQQV